MNMKQGRENAGEGAVFGRACLGCWRKVLEQMARARETLRAEARQALRGRDRLLRLALNEAEALAWQTLYPHLVFPALAAEKIQGLASWNRHQHLLDGRLNLK